MVGEGSPVSRHVPEEHMSVVLRQMLGSGEVTPPAEWGMPDLALEQSPESASLSDLLIADRDQERGT